jgi:hypothetical protein
MGGLVVVMMIEEYLRKVVGGGREGTFDFSMGSACFI